MNEEPPNRLLRLLDRLRGTALARRLQALPLATSVYRATRATLFVERARFAVSQLLGRRGTYVYTLRNGGGRLAMRHDLADIVVVDEIFWWGFYDPPAPVEARLPAVGERFTIADLGANIGAFSVWCLQRWPQSTIVAVEPDPDNARVCAQAIEANAASSRWELIEACAGPSAGTALFAAGHGAQSKVVDQAAGDTVAMPQVDAFELIADCALVKIDIESSEWPLLADKRLAEISAAAVLLEYHPQGAPSGNPRADARRLLAEAGYDGFLVEEMPGDHGIAWAWQTGSPPG